MKSRLACTAVATMAVISALALSGGPASAAATSVAASGGAQAQLALTPEECSRIRERIALLQSLVDLGEERLHYATPSQKADIIRMIRRHQAEIRRLSAQLVGCPPA